jgi:hypothetical protein
LLLFAMRGAIYRTICGSAKAIAIVFALSFVTIRAAPAGEIEVKATRNGDEMTLTATMVAPVNQRVAWEVLTDFNRMAGWVPNLQESRIVSGPDERPMRLAQKGEKRVGPFTFPFESLREIEMAPTQTIKAKGLSGNMRKLESMTRLSSEGEGTRLEYELVFIPNYWVPPLIGPALIRRESRLQFEAIIAEMVRRGETAK